MVKQFNRDDWTYTKVPRSHGFTSERDRNESAMSSEMTGIRTEILENGSAMNLLASRKGAEEYKTINKQKTLLNTCGLTWD